MSHITKVKTQLKDREILRMTLNKAGYRIHEGGSCYYEHSNPYKNAEFSASRRGERLGFKRVSDNAGYNIILDSDLIRRNGQDIVDEITQLYSQEKIMKLARSRGFSVITNRTNVMISRRCGKL